MLAALPVDDSEPERGAGERGEGKPAPLVAKAEPPALGDQVGVEVFAVVVGEVEPASLDDRDGERFNVVYSVQRKLAGEHSGIQLCQAKRLARALAEEPYDMNVNAENQRLVQVGSRVEPELAAAVAQLADAGDRSMSRQIRRAIREHVERSEVPGVECRPDTPAGRAPDNALPAVEARPLEGEGR